MKKILFFSLMLMILIVTGCTKEKTVENVENKDAKAFKEEYENLNGLEVEKNDAKNYKALNISDDNPIVYADYDKIFEVLDGTGIIYFGFPQCPWCRNAVPVLLEAAKEAGIDEINYFNIFDDRDVRKLDSNGNIIVEKEGTKQYYELLEKLGTEFTSEYSGLNDPSIRRIYVPSVIFVKDGKILYNHVSTVDSQEDPYISMNDEQKQELKQIYIKYMEEVKNDTCSVDLPC